MRVIMHTPNAYDINRKYLRLSHKYVPKYHFVLKCKDRLSNHVNIQSIFTFPDKLVRISRCKKKNRAKTKCGETRGEKS